MHNCDAACKVVFSGVKTKTLRVRIPWLQQSTDIWLPCGQSQDTQCQFVWWCRMIHSQYRTSSTGSWPYFHHHEGQHHLLSHDWQLSSLFPQHASMTCNSKNFNSKNSNYIFGGIVKNTLKIMEVFTRFILIRAVVTLYDNVVNIVLFSIVSSTFSMQTRTNHPIVIANVFSPSVLKIPECAEIWLWL